MKALKNLPLAMLLAAQLPLAFAPASGETLDDLLEETRNARAAEAAANAAREKEFLANRDRQKQLVDEAQTAWNAATARSQQLSASFDANEATLADLETKLRAREGNLGELFGVTRQVAGDTAGIIFNSLTSGQFPGRDDFFTKLAKAKTLPTITEFDTLAYELLREITETGRVARFETEIVTAKGDRERAEVVRIGPFIAMTGNKFLSFSPTIKSFSVLPRQPSSEFTKLAKEVSEAKSGYVKSVVDPSRGVLLVLYTMRPNVWERIQHGEAVGYVIILVGVIGALCAVYQFVYLVLVRRRVSAQLNDLDRPRKNNPLGRVLATFRGDPAAIEDDVEVVELRISEAVLREVPILERFQAFLRLAVAAGPLLGLIGTVIGMIITFQSITESGSSDPKLMAAGIGQAMIATVLGLGIAIPLLFANAGLTSLSRSIVQVLDEQSNGLLAEHIERRMAGAVAGGSDGSEDVEGGSTDA
jgi:biopolymer transport protein ExbB